MERFARFVLGFHGCSSEFANDLLLGRRTVSDWKPSRNKWDWLGEGIYFWEHAPERAMRWARANMPRVSRRENKDLKPAVIGAFIQLGTCFDLTDVTYTDILGGIHAQVRQEYEAKGWQLPENERIPSASDDEDLKKRHLDCLILNEAIARIGTTENQEIIDSVRGAFWEGPEAYPGAMIRKESHIQIAVRDPNCILGVFRPNLEEA